ncbi:hypothetical protein [Variovorax paradoxus]|uniref:Uncharacterized protein n=1 Tax=Variovorax paradoxus (strain EPS) TaxID=595537 RepID=E6V9U4_VARPE|nr:hypothetical protein [Variovorax paradoxus]ADU36232.1 hypothetical protein Varpa_2024 [Variovorax paradoxus EPS]
MHGFQPRSARKSDQKANGGPIRGPGTGTSDSIEKTVPEGSYIMPADSTEQLGEGSLAGLGAPMPVRVSNGEYELPPEQVHAVGVKALNAMKDATHAPVGGAPGFKPRVDESSMFFANGGDVTRIGNSYSGGDVSGQVTINGGAPRGTMSVVDQFSTPAATGPAPAVRAVASTLPAAGTAAAPVATSAGPGVIDSSAQGQQFFDQATAGTAAAQGFAPRSARAPSAPAPDGFGFQPRGFANGGAVKEEERAAFGIYPRPSAARSTPLNDAALQRGVVATGPSSFQPASVLPAASAPMRLNNLTDPRSTQFAGPTAERAPLGFSAAGTTAAKSPTAEASADVAPAPVATTGASPAAEAAPAAALGFGSTGQRRNPLGSEADANAQAADIRASNATLPQGGATIIDGAGAAQGTRQRFFDDANLRTAAARGSWSPRRGYQSDEGAVRAAALPVQARAAADVEQVRQEGEVQRAGLGFQSMAQREAAAARMQGERIAADDRRAADANSIRRDEVAGANRLRDVQVSAAQDEATLRRTLLDPNASTADRAKAQQALLAAQGKVASPEWSVQVTPATKNADGSSTEGSIYRVNKTTGDVQRVDGQGGGSSQRAAAPVELASPTTRPVGTISTVGGKSARWNGKAWEPL